VLEVEKLEDENCDVYLIEAQEVKDANGAAEEIRREFEEDDEEEELP